MNLITINEFGCTTFRTIWKHHLKMSDILNPQQIITVNGYIKIERKEFKTLRIN